MKLYDISQPIPGCAVYPGDPAPQVDTRDMGLYNLTAFSMGAHNGTHLDAPYHFYKEGKTLDTLPLEQFIGPCLVAEITGPVGAAEAGALLEAAAGCPRLLLKGRHLVTNEGAAALAAGGLLLLGVELQTVGPEDAPMAAHKALLGAGTVILEGLRLAAVTPGRYLLSAAPLPLTGTDGAPCRAVLMEL